MCKEITYEIESFDVDTGECVLKVRIDIKAEEERAALSAFIIATPRGRARMLVQSETTARRESGITLNAEG